MGEPGTGWQRALTVDLDAVRLGTALGHVRQALLAAAVVLPGLVWRLDWRLVFLWFAVALAALTLSVARGLPWRHTLLFPALAYALVIALSAFTAPYPVLAWHGAFDRQDGAFTFFSYLGLAVLPPLLLPGWHQARRLLTVVLALSAVQAALAVLQHLGAVPEWLAARVPAWYWQPKLGMGLFNSPNLAASVFALALVTGACLYLGSGSRWHLVGIAVNTAGLLASLTRGAWLLAPVALLIGLALLRCSGPLVRPRRRLAALALVILLATAALLTASPRLQHRLLAMPGELLEAMRCALGISCQARSVREIADDGNSLVQRLAIWRIGLQAVGARPWLGWGPDSYEIAWNATRDRSSLATFGLLARVDKAHSDLLQTAVTTGLLGLAAYLWLLAAALRRAWRDAKLPLEGAERAALLAGVIAYWLASQMTITHVSTAPVFWLCLGLLAVPAGTAAPANPTSH